ncbi:MAG: deoxyribodipyrimidine photo-lyase [Bacillota bacterium]|nr:deoxyribodipyrimidine photo-lyase [Bacillota bacterium]
MLRRDRFLNHLDSQDGSVICWISRDLRVEDHWGLIFAQQEALQRHQPLIVVFCLQTSFLGSLPRAFSFLLTGLEETAKALSNLSIPLVVLNGPPQDVLPAYCHQVKAGVVYCDFSPLRLAREWRTQLACRLTIPLIEVDAHNIIPCWLASDHQEYAAYTFRPKVNRQLDQWLVGFPPMQRRPFPISDDISVHAGLNEKQLAQQWKLLHEQFPHWHESPIPGSNAGKTALESFLNDGLIRYGHRNDPNAHASSRLSSWLHFGQLAPQRVALEVRNLTKASAGNDSPLEELQADFLEELIVRRELSDNFCFYNHNYDQTSAFPEWARTTLRQHQADPRPHIYNLHELEAAETADPLWNAAQQEMVNSGWMPGYLRMYWSKKILEWSLDAETAQAHAITLNDRYLLDGRDPNGYAGIAWSIGGVHDRAWNERPVFGKVRTMTSAGCRRKFNVDQYIQHTSVG